MTIAVDFDGVIHAYSKGWHDGTIYDPPLPGALDGLRALMEQHAVFIFTTRESSQVTEWLIGHGFDAITDNPGVRVFWDQRGRLLVTNQKLAATAYLDDRAVRFENWDQALHDLIDPLKANRGEITFGTTGDRRARAEQIRGHIAAGRVHVPGPTPWSETAS